MESFMDEVGSKKKRLYFPITTRFISRKVKFVIERESWRLDLCTISAKKSEGI